MEDSEIRATTSDLLAMKKPISINIINQSIDLRDSKKGDFLRLRSQAGVISPQHSKLSSNNQPTFHQMRVHSYSQYNPKEVKPFSLDSR